MSRVRGGEGTPAKVPEWPVKQPLNLIMAEDTEVQSGEAPWAGSTALQLGLGWIETQVCLAWDHHALSLKRPSIGVLIDHRPGSQPPCPESRAPTQRLDIQLWIWAQSQPTLGSDATPPSLVLGLLQVPLFPSVPQFPHF